MKILQNFIISILFFLSVCVSVFITAYAQSSDPNYYVYCPKEQFKVTWRAAPATACDCLLRNGVNTGKCGSVSGETSLKEYQNSDAGSYSITCYNYNISGTASTQTLSSRRLSQCDTSNKLDYCVMINDLNPQNRGYMWTKYTYSGFSDDYTPKNGSNSTTCNPCNVSAGETWNGISGSNAKCLSKPKSTVGVNQNNRSGWSLECENANNYVFWDADRVGKTSGADKVGLECVRYSESYTEGWGYSPYYYPPNYARANTNYDSTAPYVLGQESKISSSTPSFASRTILYSDFPDSRGNFPNFPGNKGKKGIDTSAATSELPTLYVKCPSGEASTVTVIVQEPGLLIFGSDGKFYRNGAALPLVTLRDGKASSTPITLTDKTMTVVYASECKDGNISVGRRHLAVYFPPKINISLLGLSTQSTYQINALEDYTINISSDSDSCYIADYNKNNLKKMTRSSSPTSVVSDTIYPISRYNFSYTIKSSDKEDPNSIFYAMRNGNRIGDNALGYNIICKDSTLASRLTAVSNIIVESYIKTQAKIERGAPDTVSCSSDYDAVKIEAFLKDSSNPNNQAYINPILFPGYPKYFSANQTNKFVYRSSDIVDKTKYVPNAGDNLSIENIRLTCESIKIPKNKDIANSNSDPRFVVSPSVDDSNSNTNQIIVNAKCNYIQSNIPTKECNAVIANLTNSSCLTTINDTPPASTPMCKTPDPLFPNKCLVYIDGKAYETTSSGPVVDDSKKSVQPYQSKDYSLDLNLSKWTIKCTNDQATGSFTLNNPFKEPIKINSFEVNPTELPCNGGSTKALWNISGGYGTVCELTDKGEQPFNNNGNFVGVGSVNYSNITERKKIELKCKKDINSDGLYDLPGETVSLSRFVNVACRLER